MCDRVLNAPLYEIVTNLIKRLQQKSEKWKYSQHKMPQVLWNQSKDKAIFWISFQKHF